MANPVKARTAELLANRFHSLDSALSYASPENLVAKLIQLGLDTENFKFALNTKGRWTAIFPARGGANIHIAHLGFNIMG